METLLECIMTGELGYSLPPAVRRIANNFRLIGWVGFWTQIVFGVIAALLFTVSLLGLLAVERDGGTNPVSSIAIFLTVLGVLAVFVGAFWAFQYTRFARKLKASNPDLRPKPKNAAQMVATGLSISILGMLLGLLGAGSSVGRLFIKVIALPQAGTILRADQAIEAVDVFLIQSTIITLLCHYVGIVGSLWLSRTINKQS
jgi:cytochrome b561